MKKSLKNLGLSLCTLMLLAGCSCSKDNDDSVKANINNGNENIIESGLLEGTKNITLQKLYDELKSELGNQKSADKLLEIIAEKEFLSDPTWKSRYDAKMEEKLMKLVKSGSYNVNGEFSEKMLVASLKAQYYDIDCGENPVYGPTYVPAEEDELDNVIVDKYLKCD